MIHEHIALWDKYPEAKLVTYVSDDVPEMKMPPRRALIICPGGGYSRLSAREGESVAKFFLAGGMNVFILYYSTGENACDFIPLTEASLAVWHVRENAAKYNIDPERVFVAGFSAGGHLAASIATLWHKDIIYAAAPGMPYGANKPTGVILSYPVISAFVNTHQPTIKNAVGHENPTEEELHAVSIDRHVDERTSPAFIWHTVADATVPVQNAMIMAGAMIEKKIPVELHIFPKGPHGLSLCTKETCSAREGYIEPRCANWAKLALTWMETF